MHHRSATNDDRRNLIVCDIDAKCTERNEILSEEK